MKLGREQSAAINRFLLLVDPERPKRRIPSDRKIARLQAELPKAAPGLQKLLLRTELTRAIATLKESTDGGPEWNEAEAGFVEYAGAYSKTKDISYSIWREFGVPAATLKKAGIKRDATNNKTA